MSGRAGRGAPHIVVFFGGETPSHDLSVETGRWVCEYMPRQSYQVTPVLVNPDGTWQMSLGSLPKQGSVTSMMKQLFNSLRHIPAREGWQRLLQRPVDSLMSVIRGKGGDDGQFQHLGKTLHIPVIGSPTEACHIASHKNLGTRLIDDLVATPFSFEFRENTDPNEVAENIRSIFVPPVILKPLQQEGSAGTHVVDSFTELVPAIRQVQEYGAALAQEMQLGQEISLTLFEYLPGKMVALPQTVIVPRASSYYDYEAKRRPGRVKLHTTHQPDNDVLQEAEVIARDVFERMGCKGYASFDFINTKEGLVLLETNTVPVASAATPLIDQLRVAGLHPTKFLDHLIKRSFD